MNVTGGGSGSAGSSSGSGGGFSDEAIGFAAVVVSVLIFGSWGVPLKLKAVRESNIDNVVFQSYSSLTVSLLGLFVLIWSDFVFSWWGIGGAFMWIFTQIFAMSAVTMVGVAIGIPIIAATTIITSFLWGVAAFGEVPSSLALSIVGIAMILVGVVGVSQTQTALPNKLAQLFGLTKCITQPATENGNGADHEGMRPVPTTETVEMIEPNSQDITRLEDDDEKLVNDDDSDHASPSTQQPPKKTPSRTMGMASAIACGLLNGTMMVPVTMFAKEQEQAAQLALEADPNAVLPNINGLTYLISMSIGIIVLDPLVMAAYSLARRKWPYYPLRATLIPGLVCGVLWFFGNVFAIYATQYLGNTVGYPLTQTSLLIAACWGVGFREIRGFGIVMLAVAAAVLLAGAGLLALFGNGGTSMAEPLMEP